MIFISKIPSREIKRFTPAQVDTNEKHVLFLHEQLAHLHTRNTQKKVSNIVPNEEIMENNYNNKLFVMSWNLSLISHRYSHKAFFDF